VRLTDTQDPIILWHLPKNRAEQCRRKPEALRNEIVTSRPILFIVARTGLVYWHKNYSHLDYEVSQTAISLPLSRLDEYIERHQDCVIEFADFEPAPSKRRSDEVGDLIAAFAVRQIPGGLALPPDVERLPARRRGLAHPQQHLPGPAGHLHRADPAACPQPGSTTHAPSALHAAVAARLPAGTTRRPRSRSLAAQADEDHALPRPG